MKTFSVKNFERFQHYKDRAPPWIKLYNELLEDYDFGLLPDALKGQLMCIWLLASRMENKLPFDAKWLAKKINATSPVDIHHLLLAGFIVPHTPEAAKGKREDWPSRYVPDAVRAAVLERDGHKCRQCSDENNLEIDHIKPVSKGGTGEESNLQVLCRSCNRKKRAILGYSDAEQVATQELELRSLEGEERRERVETEQIAASPAKSRKKPTRSIPDNFEMNATNHSYANAFGFTESEKKREHQRFCMHAKAKALTYADWDAAEHNWITKAAEFAGKRIRSESEIANDGSIEVLDQVQLEAWDAYGMAQNGRAYPRNKKGGWRFPSKWPPGYERKMLDGVNAIMATQ